MRCGAHAIVASLAAALALGCASASTQKRTTVPPAGVRTLSPASRYLKAHLRDGRAYIFDRWAVGENAVTGTGRVLDPNRVQVSEGALNLPLDSAVLFESNEVQSSAAVGLLTIPTVVTMAVAAICLSNPKACFGSCPTFYATDGERDVLMAEGFSASVAPSLEATDVDALYRARPDGRRLALRMTNEAMETHVVRFARVLTAPRPESGRVFATPENRFVAATALAAPSRCAAAEGDCGPLVSAFDGRERFSPADSADLAAREEVDLVFDAPPQGPLGLVVAARQTLLTTYVFYQGLAYLGTRAGDFLAALERGTPGARGAAGAAGVLLGGIEVLVPAAEGRWINAGRFFETGPLGTDARIIPLPRFGTGPVHVRLRLTKGLWRLDWLALAALGAEVTPARLAPAEVRRDGAVDEAARIALTDSTRALVTYPGDEYALVFDLPDVPERLEFFLESRGYYLEWIRPEWIAEEDLARAARMFSDPARALREMAPEFKRQEAGMERSFWGSRYVRH
jgi:hypothetical protein